MLNRVKGKVQAAFDKAIATNIHIDVVVSLLKIIGFTLALIAGFLALLVIIFFSRIGAQ